MTISNHIIAALSASTTVAVTTPALAAISEQVQIVMIGAFVSLVTGVVTIVYAYKAKTLSQQAKDVAEATGIAVDGKMDKMLALAKELSHAEGVVEGTATAETKAALSSAAKAEGRAEVKAAASPIHPPDPLLPTQAQPVAAKAVEGVKLTEEQLEKMISELQAELKDNRVNPAPKPPV